LRRQSAAREARAQKNLRVIHEEKFDCLARLSALDGARERHRLSADIGVRRRVRGARWDQTNMRALPKHLLARCAIERARGFALCRRPVDTARPSTKSPHNASARALRARLFDDDDAA
jgi:hypothetical protein